MATEEANAPKTYVVGTKPASDMDMSDIEKEIEEISNLEKTTPRLITLSVGDRARELVYEIQYRKIYQPQGYSRFEAGQMLFHAGL